MEVQGIALLLAEISVAVHDVTIERIVAAIVEAVLGLTRLVILPGLLKAMVAPVVDVAGLDRARGPGHRQGEYERDEGQGGCQRGQDSFHR